MRMEQAWNGSRRAWLGRAAVAAYGMGWGLHPFSLARAQEPRLADDEAAVREAARHAGLGRQEVARTEHFLAVGDAPGSYLRAALERCESLGKDFLTHFRGRGFELAYPSRRLTVVGLKDDASYGKLLGEAPGRDVGGHFDLDLNRLVIFDFRADGERSRQEAERINLFTLVHETAHQLCYNTGLLDRDHVPPLCISEGLATYVELWRPNVKNAIGGVNTPRLEALRQVGGWIDLDDLLRDDSAFEGEQQQLAYAESWLLIHHLMRATARRERLRDYLTRIRTAPGTDSAARLKVAEAALGALSRLNKEVKDEARSYFRR